LSRISAARPGTTIGTSPMQSPDGSSAGDESVRSRARCVRALSGWNGPPLGFPPSSAPRRPGADDARRGRDRPSSTDLELRAQRRISRSSNRVAHSQRATSRRTRRSDRHREAHDRVRPIAIRRLAWMVMGRTENRRRRWLCSTLRSPTRLDRPPAGSQFGTRLVPGRVRAGNDEGHLAVALEVSVGRFAGPFRVPRLVGRDSGGGIRTRDLRVMSPTSYQTAPPRGGRMIVAPPHLLASGAEPPRHLAAQGIDAWSEPGS
jgi:hypothetical protein